MSIIRRGSTVRYIGQEHPIGDARAVGVVTSFFEEGGDTYATVDWPPAPGTSHKRQGVAWVGDLEPTAGAARRNPSRLRAALIALKVNAGNDRNGNPRRGWLIIDPMKPDDDPGFVAEGYMGHGALRDAGIDDYREVPVQLEIPPSQYRTFQAAFGLTRED